MDRGKVIKMINYLNLCFPATDYTCMIIYKPLCETPGLQKFILKILLIFKLHSLKKIYTYIYFCEHTLVLITHDH